MKPPAVAVRKHSSGGSKLNFDRLKSNFDGGKPASGVGQMQREKSNPFDDDDDDEQENDQTIDIDQDPFEDGDDDFFESLDVNESSVVANPDRQGGDDDINGEGLF